MCIIMFTADTSEIVHQATPDSSFEETSEETREQGVIHTEKVTCII